MAHLRASWYLLGTSLRPIRVLFTAAFPILTVLSLHCPIKLVPFQVGSTPGDLGTAADKKPEQGFLSAC